MICDASDGAQVKRWSVRGGDILTLNRSHRPHLAEPAHHPARIAHSDMSRPAPPIPTAGSTSASTSSSRKPNVIIGDYEIISTLGHGSFGKVKLAKHTLTGLKVAMKFISKRKISTAEMSNRVRATVLCFAPGACRPRLADFY